MQRDQEQERKETPEEQLATPHALIAPSPQTLVEKQKSAEGLPSSLESKRYYRTLTFTTAQIFWTIQPNGLADSTSMWGAYTGQTEEELKGTGWMEAIHPDDREILRQKWKEVRAAKGILAIEYRVRRHDGIYRTFAVQGIPVFTKEGNIREWVGASTDITEKKELEDKLHNTTQRFRSTFEQAPVGVAHIGLRGQFLFINQKFCTIVNYTHDELLASTFHKLIPIENTAIIIENATKLISGEIKVYKREKLYIRNEVPSWVDFTITLVRDSVGKPAYFVVIAEEITERKLAEKRTHSALNALLAMAESLVALPDETSTTTASVPTTHKVSLQLTELTRQVLGCEHIGFLAIDPQTNAITPIAAAGFSLDEARKETISNLLQQPRFKQLTSKYLPRLLSDEIVIIDRNQPPNRILPNPHHVHFTLIAPMKVYDQFVGIIFLDYGNQEHEYTKDEMALIKAVAHLAALVIERQRLLSERAEAQAAELAQREANRRMDDFLSMASHELRTPLTTINVHIQVANRLLRKLLQQITDEKAGINPTKAVVSVQEMLNSAEHQVEVLNRLFNDLIDISRIQTNKLKLHIRIQTCDLVALLQEVVTNQHYRTPTRTIQLVLPPTKPDTVLSVPVQADPDRIAQVLINYLTNAIKYSPEDRPITIYLLIPSATAQIAVRDEGPGLSPQEQAHIWERFYQSDNGHAPMDTTSAGLGLGLYISRSLIEEHGGQVGVESNPGEGSTFWFTLPLAP